MPKRKPDQPVGGDIDWFVISVDNLRRWGILAVIVLATAFLAYFVYNRSRRSPEEKARAEIATATALISKASSTSGSPRPGSNISQARDSLRGAEESFSKKSWDEAFRL